MYRIALALALPVAVSAAHAHEFIGPPDITPVGCDVRVPWDAAYLQTGLGLSETHVRRFAHRWQLTAQAACNLPKQAFDLYLKLSRNDKHNFDSPDSAERHRLLRLQGDDGTVNPAGHREALAARAAMVAKGRAKGAGISATSWVALGPGNVGGRVRAIAPHPTREGELLIGSVSGGLWLSTDAGRTWRVTNDHLPTVAISCLTRDPASPEIVYACTGEGAGNADAIIGAGIYKSTDGGRTWAQMPSTIPSSTATTWSFVNRLAVSRADSNLLLAATHFGIQRSTDGGATWSRVYGDIPGQSGLLRRVFDLKFSPHDPNRVLAAERTYTDGSVTGSTNGGAVALSLDAGLTWQRIRLDTATQPPENVGRVEIAFAPSQPNLVYASANFGTGRIYRSLDGGATWVQIAAPGHLGNQGWYDNTLWVAPNDPARVVVGGVNTFMSLNATSAAPTFSRINTGAHVDHHALVSHPDYTSTFALYNGNDGGVYRWTGLNTASTATPPVARSLNNGLPITQFYGGAGFLSAGGRVSGGTQDNGTWLYYGSLLAPNPALWASMFGGDGGEAAIDPSDGNFHYGSVQNLYLFRNKFALREGDPPAVGSPVTGYICEGILDTDCGPGTPATNFIAPFILDPNDPNVLYAGANRLWRSTNAKAAEVAWRAIKPALDASTTIPISAIAVPRGAANVIWVAHNNGRVFCTNDGTSDAPTWIEAGRPQARFATRIVIDADDRNKVTIAYGGYAAGNLMQTRSGCVAGATFTSISGNLPQVPVRALVRHPSLANWLYAGTEIGVFTSEDGGATWGASNDGPGTVSVEELFWWDEGMLVAATHGRGFFRAEVSPPALVGNFKVEQPRLTVAEDAGTAVIRVRRVGGAQGAVSVNYSTVGDTATPGADFMGVSGTLRWAAGETGVKTVAVPIVADGLADPDETFTFVLSDPQGGAALGQPATTLVRISEPEVFPVNCQMPAGWASPATARKTFVIDNTRAFEGRCSLVSEFLAEGETAAIEFTLNGFANQLTLATQLTDGTLRVLRNGMQTGSIGASSSWNVSRHDVSGASARVIRLEYTPGAGGARIARIDLAGIEPASTSTAGEVFSAVTGSGVLGRVTLGGNQTLPVTLTAIAPFTLASVTVIGPFRVVRNGCAGLALSVGQACVVEVTAEPVAVGNLVGALRLQPLGAEARTVALSATLIEDPTTVAAAPPVTELGNVLPGVSVRLSPAFTNIGGATFFTSTGFYFPISGRDEFSFGGFRCGTLRPGQSCDFDILWRPVLPGTVALRAGIDGNTLQAAGSVVAEFRATVLPTPAATTLSIAPASITFGEVRAGSESASVLVTLTNTGPDAYAFGTPVVTGPFAVVANDCIARTGIARGARCDVLVAFRPIANGVFTGTLSFGGNLAAPARIALSGTGAATLLTANTGTLDFGSVAQGATSAMRTLTYTNRSTGALVPLLANVAAPFAVTANTCAGGVAAGATCSITVTFRPTALGRQVADLALAYDQAGSAARVTLTGTGTVPSSPQTGWWWNAAESGRGLFIERRGDNLLVAGYYYEADGRAAWFIASGPVNGASFSADMRTLRNGQTLTGPYRPGQEQASLGRLTLTFASDSAATLVWPAGTIPLTRYAFGPGAATGIGESGWWWNSAESGRGFSIEVQGRQLFMVGFMYDDAGNPVWYATQGQLTGNSAYAGNWVQYGGGQTLTGTYRPPTVVNGNVGSVRLDWTSTTTATLTLPDGRMVPLVRFLF